MCFWKVPAGSYTYSKLTIETLEQGVKYVQERYQDDANDVVLVSLLLLWIYFTPCFSVSVVNFEKVNAGCGITEYTFVNSVAQVYKINSFEFFSFW